MRELSRVLDNSKFDSILLEVSEKMLKDKEAWIKESLIRRCPIPAFVVGMVRRGKLTPKLFAYLQKHVTITYAEDVYELRWDNIIQSRAKFIVILTDTNS